MNRLTKIKIQKLREAQLKELAERRAQLLEEHRAAIRTQLLRRQLDKENKRFLES